MGTNYYVTFEPCFACGEQPDDVHIGKCSAGWRFLFRLHPNLYQNIDDLRLWLMGKRIKDEYGNNHTEEAFWGMVEERQRRIRRKDEPRCDAFPPGSLYDGEIEIAGYRFQEREFS
jgi:hypothetical protein